MTVWNDRLQEEDYIDLDLLPKLYMPTRYLFDLREPLNLKKAKKICFSFERGQKDGRDIVLYVARCDDIEQVHEMEVEELEKMLQDIIMASMDDPGRAEGLQDTEYFQSVNRKLVDLILTHFEDDHYAEYDRVYIINNGIGIIHDVKAEQDVGTFEGFTFFISRYEKSFCNIENIILSGRDSDDLRELERYQFTYLTKDKLYNLSFGVNFKFQNHWSLDIRSDSLLIGQLLSLEGHNLKISIDVGKSDNHRLYPMVQDILNNKELPDIEDELSVQEFTEKRLKILSYSKSRIKKEQMVSQFADIEI